MKWSIRSRSWCAAVMCGWTGLAAIVAPAATARADEATAGHGFLQVFSAKAWKLRDDEPRVFVHGAYKVLTPRGAVVQTVANGGPTAAWSEPDLVRLPPGEYIVRAPAHRRGLVEVPVQVVAGRTKVLRLDAAAAKERDGGALKRPEREP